MIDTILIPLIPVAVGAGLTLITSLILNRKNFISSLDEELAKERIAAYKSVYKLISQLNHYVGPKQTESIPKECFLGYISTKDNEYLSMFNFSSVFFNFHTFHNYKSEFSVVLNNERIFLNQETVNKLSFLDSYLSEIWQLAHGKDDAYLHMVGFALSNEIEEMIIGIERDIQIFFNNQKCQKAKNNFRNTYKYIFNNRKQTDLYNLFLKDDSVNRFGEFALCYNCKNNKDCPLNKYECEESET